MFHGSGPNKDCHATPDLASSEPKLTVGKDYIVPLRKQVGKTASPIARSRIPGQDNRELRDAWTFRLLSQYSRRSDNIKPERGKLRTVQTNKPMTPIIGQSL